MNIPAEILQDIFEYLVDHRDLKQCQQTCRIWSRPAQTLLYGKVKLMTSTMDYITTITTSPNNLGTLLKVINLDYILEEDYASTIAILGQFCPNIQTIELRTANLLPLYEPLVQECRNGRFQKLKVIPFPIRTSELDSYACLAFLTIDRLENLHLYDVKRRVRVAVRQEDINRFEQTVSALSRFTSLEKLTVKKHAKVSLPEFNKIVDRCNSLKSLRFQYITSEYPDDDTIMDLALIRPHSRIHTFCGNVVYSEKSIKYIMCKLPNLDKMILNWEGKCFRLSESTMVDLLRYVSRMSYAQANDIYTENVYNCLIPFMKGTSFRCYPH